MKRKNRLRLLLALTAAVFPCLDAFASSQREEPLRAAFFYSREIWVQDINIMQQIGNSIANALEDAPEVSLSCYGTDSLTMDQAVRAVISMETDVLFYYGLDSENAKINYQRLLDHGIRLILVDGDIEESGRFAYIGTDNYQSGRQAVELIQQEAGADARVGVLAPDIDTALCSVSSRLDGFLTAAREAGLSVEGTCETTYDSLSAIKSIRKFLETYPDVDVLYCAEAVSGQAAADVLRELGREDDLMVLTYDINSRIQEDLMEGALDITLSQDTEAVGQACADLLLELAKNRGMEEGNDVFFSCIPITSEDLEAGAYEE